MHDSRTQIYEETNYFKKNYKFWTEPRSCMVLGLKPMGKPTILRKSKFWTKPRSCMILGLKLMGKPTTLRKTISFGQNQDLAWFLDSNLWGNQLL